MTADLIEADSADLDAVMTIMGAAFDTRFGEAWTRSQCAGILPMHGVTLLVARDERDPLGFCLYRTVADDAELLLLAVAPANQRRGIGKQLLHRFVADSTAMGACRIHLEVRDGNPAVRLYEAAGFKEVGRRRKYYRGNKGEQFDALTFVLAEKH